MRRFALLMVFASAACGSSGAGDATGEGGRGAAPGEGGASGVAGTSGSAGSPGGAGTTGIAGSSGVAGTTGSAGSAGSAGSTGLAGTTGLAGSTGVAGSTGLAGTTGVAGAIGSAGAGGVSPGGRGGGTAGASAGHGGGIAGASAGRGGAAGGVAGAGGTGRGGASGVVPFWMGADVTDQEPQPDATRANLLSTMKQYGFNAIRLRTFVDPKAADGYDKQNGYADIAHTVTFGKQIVDAGMALLVDFHYSDNWADPGKQCVPVAWQGFTTIDQMAAALHDYTKDAITKLVAGGARPVMVQIGNETTPGMLLHRCDSGGLPTGSNPVTGSLSNWTNLGKLFKAGVAGVKEVDPTILTSLHIDQGDGLSASRSYIMNARTQGVVFEAFGESCYTAYQGQPSTWKNTFTELNKSFPDLLLFIAEYGPEQRAANDIIFDLPNQRGIGTFNWEPTTRGAWNDPNHDLLRRSGSTYTVQPDMAQYTQMKADYANRL